MLSATPGNRALGLGPKVPRRRLSAESMAVMAWLALYLLCAALGVYSTASTVADLLEEERIGSESRAR